MSTRGRNFIQISRWGARSNYHAKPAHVSASHRLNHWLDRRERLYVRKLTPMRNSDSNVGLYHAGEQRSAARFCIAGSFGLKRPARLQEPLMDEALFFLRAAW